MALPAYGMHRRRELDFPGVTLAHVEAMLAYLAPECVWRGWYAAREAAATPQTMAHHIWHVWAIDAADAGKQGIIDLFELPTETRVTFTDGCDPWRRNPSPCIGADLDALADALWAVLDPGRGDRDIAESAPRGTDTGGRSQPVRIGSKPESPPRKSQPTQETVRKAYLFKGIKDAHPSWSYARVALEATRSAAVRVGNGEKPQVYQGHNVRGAYKAMGWPWLRADQIR